jgi:two-component system response regulator RegA
MNPDTTILVVDDNQAWRETLADYLRGRGVFVWTAADARQGLAFLEGHRVALVVCDYHLPGMNGLEFIRQLRMRRQPVAILMLSSDQEPNLATRAVAEGACAFVAKTTSPGILLRTVRQLLESVGNVMTSGSTLRPWQRLLPSPRRAPHRFAG